MASEFNPSNGDPIYFYAPSMGPFNCASRNKLRKEVISGAERIILRDPISVKYVKDFAGC